MSICLKNLPASITQNVELSDVLALCREGRPEEAERVFRDRIGEESRSDETDHLLAIIHHLLGKDGEALKLIGNLLGHSPDAADLQVTLGNFLLDGGMLPEAKEAYSTALASDAHDYAALWSLGNYMQITGSPDEAIAYFREAVSVDGEQPVGLLALGSALLSMDRLDEAAAEFALAAERAVGHQMHYDVGIALMICGRFEAAAAAFEAALRELPDDAKTMMALGRLLHRSGRVEKAREIVTAILERDPVHVEANHVLAGILADSGEVAAAESVIKVALAEAPGLSSLRAYLGSIQVSTGNGREGWLNFEARKPNSAFARWAQRIPMWRGEPLEKNRLLVTAEGSPGDIFHFLRYFETFQVLDRDLTLEVPEPLVPLLASNPFGVKIVGDRQSHNDYQFVTRQMSLPLLSGRYDPFVPHSGSWLSANESRQADWVSHLPEIPGLRVAILPGVIPTATTYPGAWLDDLAAIDGVFWISLAGGDAAQEIEKRLRPGSLMQVGEQVMHDPTFMDAAALLSLVDLLITRDGDIAHLAGAMGVPTWLLLEKRFNWRWGEASTETLWYPTTKLRRNFSMETMSGIARELKKLSESKAFSIH